MKRIFQLIILFPLWFSPCALAQESSAYEQFTKYLQNAAEFNYYFPQEKIYLHLDNNCYFIGDTLWFKAYVVATDSNTSTLLSRVLYVELLTPEGNVADSRKLEIKEGQCHGEFPLNKLLMFSGFYEIRAYTRYMMNFGEEAGFSRVIPIYDKPKIQGEYSYIRILWIDPEIL